MRYLLLRMRDAHELALCADADGRSISHWCRVYYGEVGCYTAMRRRVQRWLSYGWVVRVESGREVLLSLTDEGRRIVRIELQNKKGK